MKMETTDFKCTNNEESSTTLTNPVAAEAQTLKASLDSPTEKSTEDIISTS